MIWTIAAFTGGFFVGGFVFYVIGASKGYICAVRHLTAIGSAVLQNSGATRAIQQQQPKVPSTTTRLN